MSSAISFYSSIFSVLLLLLTGCGQSSTSASKFRPLDAAKDPLFNTAFITMIDEPPVNFPECWNRESLRKAGIKTVSMCSKGGKNPDDTLELMVLNYSSNWSKLTYHGYKFDETRTKWTDGSITLDPAQRLGEIVFNRHFGIDKPLKTIIRPIDDGYLLLRSKSGNRCDTTWLIGTLQQPKAVISKIGKTLFSIDLYLPEGSSTNSITWTLQQLPFTSSAIAGTQCTVIFTRSGRPVNAFLLNEKFSQVSKTRSWTYTSDHRIATFKEWMGTALIRDISCEYGESQLPTSITVNRKTYFYRYE